MDNKCKEDVNDNVQDIKDNAQDIVKFEAVEKETGGLDTTKVTKLNSKKKTISTRDIAFTALFTAMVYATTLIAIPNGVGGIINFGDAMILLCCAVMNPFSAMIAGGVGAALADITLPGCAIWAPFTLIIKCVMGLCCGFIMRSIKKFLTCASKRKHALWIVCALLSFVFAELIMVVGYFGAALLISKFDYALASVQFVSNFIQMAIALGVVSILLFVMRIDLLFDKIYHRK